MAYYILYIKQFKIKWQSMAATEDNLTFSVTKNVTWLCLLWTSIVECDNPGTGKAKKKKNVKTKQLVSPPSRQSCNHQEWVNLFTMYDSNKNWQLQNSSGPWKFKDEDAMEEALLEPD